jgi:hypothetical protein
MISLHSKKHPTGRRKLPIRYTTLALIIVLLSMAVSFSDEDTAQLTIINRTKLFLHVIIDGKPYLYLSPERGITHESEAKPTFSVTVFYSPGQSSSRTINRTIRVPYTSSDWGCSWGSEGCESTSTGPQAGSTVWEVTSDTMLTSLPPAASGEGVIP